MVNAKAQRRFLICALSTVVIIYMLILVGGIVRATGAGMGCPDWPTCFGRWIPPTSEAQLPANYQTIYADRGYADTTFNLRKTWTEYLNRLLGVFTGFAILVTLLFSNEYRRSDKSIFYLSFMAFILVGVQGWLGSRVVASNLHPGLITVHMLLAQVIVCLIIMACVRAYQHSIDRTAILNLPAAIYPLMWFAMIAGLVQLLLGTQVREAIDLVAKQSNYVNRHLWIDNLPIIFNVHKVLSIPVVGLNLWFAYRIRGSLASTLLSFLALLLMGLVTGTAIMGMSMERLNLPMFAQPLHLWLASLILGVQFAIYLIVRQGRIHADLQNTA
ncbi:MAG: COX15/CtaA family protein [Granulosicoccaceae bacterium]